MPISGRIRLMLTWPIRVLNRWFGLAMSLAAVATRGMLLAAFLMMFGLVGFALYRASHAGAPLSLAGGLLAGVAAAWLMALMFRGMSKLQSAGNYDPRQAIGQRGSVYLTIPEAGTGKVTVTVNNRLSVLEAVAQDRKELKTGENIEVVEVAGTSVLVVRRA